MSQELHLAELERALQAKLAEHLEALPAKRVVLAVSGGADSLALMHACARWQLEWNAEFLVASLDHGLRGDVGREDCEAVRELATEWGLSCVVGTVNTQSFAKSARLNLEDAARILRYNFLADVAQKQHAPVIFTAHHADDQVETVLAHFLRGSGIRGLAGMRERQALAEHPTILHLRPLLGFCRAQLSAYCTRMGLHPREDVTNADLQHTRNRLRHNTLPLLRQYNPQLDASILRLAKVAADAEDYLRSQANTFLQNVCQQRDGAVEIPRAQFITEHRTLQLVILRDAVFALGGRYMPYQAALVQAQHLAEYGAGEKLQKLTRDIRLRLAYEVLVIEHEDAPLPDGMPLLPAGYRLPLDIPGSFPLPESTWSLVIKLAASENEGEIRLPQSSQIFLRTRQPGDRFTPAGMKSHSKSLKRWLIDRKVPRQLRGRLPLLIVDGAIAAIHCHGRWHIGEQFRPTTGRLTRIYHLRWLR